MHQTLHYSREYRLQKLPQWSTPACNEEFYALIYTNTYRSKHELLIYYIIILNNFLMTENKI